MPEPEHFELIDRQRIFEDIDLERGHQDAKYPSGGPLDAENAMIAIQHQLDQWHSAETLRAPVASYHQAIQVAAIAVNYLEGLQVPLGKILR